MSSRSCNFRPFLLLLAGALVLALAGCGAHERLSYETEVDEPFYREGQSLLKTGRKQEALSAFLKVIEKRGDDAPESHLEVGLLSLQHLSDPLAAIYHFKKFLGLRPNSPQAALIRQRIAAATREFARTLPAQPLENQLQRVDLVATLDRLTQENERLKQQLADLQAGRADSTSFTSNGVASSPAARAVGGADGPVSFNLETMPVVHTQKPPPTSAPGRMNNQPAATVTAPKKASPPPPTTRGARKYVVRPGDTLVKISQQIYGTKSKFKDIYHANRGVMKTDSDLKVGMELTIP